MLLNLRFRASVRFLLRDLKRETPGPLGRTGGLLFQVGWIYLVRPPVRESGRP